MLRQEMRLWNQGLQSLGHQVLWTQTLQQMQARLLCQEVRLVPRPAKPGAPGAVDPDPAPDANSLAAPRNASVAPRPARPLPPLSAAPPRSERDSSYFVSTGPPS